MFRWHLCCCHRSCINLGRRSSLRELNLELDISMALMLLFQIMDKFGWMLFAERGGFGVRYLDGAYAAAMDHALIWVNALRGESFT